MAPSTATGRRLWKDCMSAGFVLSLISSAAAQDHQPRPAKARPVPGIETLVTDALLTLRADGAPLAEVLRAIGAAGGFRVVLRGAFVMPVRESFAGQPLEDAIRRLVEGHSVVVLRDAPASASGAADLAEIRVIENPALAASEGAGADRSAPVVAESAPDEATDEPPLDREAFRLSRLGEPPPTRDDVLFELGDPDPAARVAAVPKVGSLGPRAAIGILSGVFAEEDDPQVRSRAVAALTRLDGLDTRGLLRERALEDDDPALRMQALNALAASAGDRSVNVIGQALRQDAEPEVRMAAIRALGRVGGDWARRYLERAVTDLDPEIGLAAEQALAAWPEPAK